MCGFVGIFGQPNKAQRSLLEESASFISNRGPDDKVVLNRETFSLAFHRLAILAPENGEQPISNETGDVWAVVNGEIYNYKKLRKDLSIKGHKFKTESDSEVVVHLYEEFGEAFVEQLNGMFAFAIIDERKRALYLGRDRFGIKPLFYSYNGVVLTFGSDARAVANLDSRAFNEKSFFSLLGLSYIHDETVFSGVRSVVPATIISFHDDKILEKKYWSLVDIENSEISISEAKEKARHLLQDSIALQMQSDVPLGIFLSGGLDSSSLVALANEFSDVQLNTYAVNFEHKSELDQKFARNVAEIFGTAHSEISLTVAEATRGLDELLPLLDEPFSDTAMIATYLLAKFSRNQGVLVLLSGAGADEVFGGYSRHQNPTFFSKRYLLHSFMKKFGGTKLNFGGRILRETYLKTEFPVLDLASQISGVNYHQLSRILKKESFSEVLGKLDLELQGVVKVRPGMKRNLQIMKYDLKSYLTSNVLSLTDKATMASSVEARVPFLDHRIVELVYSLPIDYVLPSGESKPLLRKLVADCLPIEILKRRKQGFNAPLKQWINNGLHKQIRENLLDDLSPKISNHLHKPALEKVLANKKATISSAETLFSIYVTNKWLGINY